MTLKKTKGSLYLITIGNPLRIQLVNKLGRVIVDVPDNQEVGIATTPNLHGWKMDCNEKSRFLIDLEEVQ